MLTSMFPMFSDATGAPQKLGNTFNKTTQQIVVLLSVTLVNWPRRPLPALRVRKQTFSAAAARESDVA